MKLLIVVENLVMDGVKRASTVLGNALASQADVTYYSLAHPRSFYRLQAPLVVAPHPVDDQILNYFGDAPLQKYAIQITDLITFLRVGQYDSVILPGGLLTSFAPAIKASLPRLNVIAWMHNNVETYLYQYYVHMQKEFKTGLIAADAVVTLTASDLEGYSRFNPHTVKIYNPLTLNAAGHRADLRYHTIAFTGRIDIQHKGIDYLLALARQLPDDWQISMAGKGTPSAMATFDQLLTDLNVQDRIIYRGALKDEALRQHYQQASIFVMTSRWEGMPLVMGEAMALGLPVAAMTNTGSAEYLQGGRYGVLTPAHDVIGLWHGMQPLMADLSLREAYAQRSLQRAKAFSLPKIIRAWQGLLNRSYLPQVTVSEGASWEAQREG
ncbi:glycosyltransferase [Lactiplantibacillus mudanjiangensis]|uniref:Glycosyl transferase family 1 [Lactobacillus pentosus] n=1 Tax=Lactiplantibacillus mudanjiangensis TaxID=1296538 RepID=A0A660DWD4_9LACO|nr:glycosyltransferase [Lactiplantibacillus mudanjiangensis]VDG18917.1 glycosyl transferase family 1 [Lactobacillus pentosus] [Lactiplantibacillus mudanjiangensis]VDG25305.1 glycosyl transferase family 1 [Lactobacillus pentosus] [Lactiplantibacillus mudanjiangensis]VDG27668.1 glycosyl transferase family 1 [Lactobacillus pentosus] [Lactiplantibacillus mudanjiangensis]VDG33016.1 glycosyl transferase family 1 [Lactobacillus pentosus] [Lactiplantibacillus mudanjiangensis]